MARIVCTVTNDLSYDQRMIRICASLAKAGHGVLLVGRKRPNSTPLASQPFRQKRLPCFFESGKLFYLEYNLRLFIFLLSTPFDIGCAVDLDTLLPGLLVSRLKGNPLVYDAHEYFTEVPEVVRRPAIRRVWEWVARFTIPRLRYAYTVGPALARELERRYSTPFAVIRNLPYRSGRLLQPSDGPAILLYQGALNEGRGLECAIRAMAYIEGAQLWLAGEGDLSDSLRRQCRQLGLEGRVRFLGYLAPEELQELTPKAWIGLNLLENKGLSYYYSLANKAFDYIQAGLPSLQMAFPEYVALQEEHHTFVLLEKLDPKVVAATVTELLRDEKRYFQIQENCLKAREHLNWENEEEKLIRFYRRLSPGH